MTARSSGLAGRVLRYLEPLHHSRALPRDVVNQAMQSGFTWFYSVFSPLVSAYVRLGLHYDPVKAKQVFKLCSRRDLLVYSRLNSVSRL